jgi:hypothetical protein
MRKVRMSFLQGTSLPVTSPQVNSQSGIEIEHRWEVERGPKGLNPLGPRSMYLQLYPSALSIVEDIAAVVTILFLQCLQRHILIHESAR